MQARNALRWIVLAGLLVPALAWGRVRGRGPWDVGPARHAAGAGPVLRVLSVGVTRYRDQPYLSYAVRDARAVAQAFRDRGRGVFARVEARVLVDDEADRRTLLKAFDQLRRGAGPRDVTVLYYVGHSGNDEPIGFYLAPGQYHDKFWRQTMIKGTELQRAWGAIPGRVLVLLDTCYTGALWEDEDEPATPRPGPSHGEAVLAATRTSEGTKGSRFWPGDFTQALLGGLAGTADADGDGRVTLGELESHLVRRVEARRGGRQHVISAVPPELRTLTLSRP
jgi:hypothetical protein